MDRICEICGKSEGKIINSKKFEKTVCTKHYMQLQQHGRIFEKTRKDANEYTFDSSYAYIQIYDNKGYKKDVIRIDIEDMPICKQYKWNLKKDGHIKSIYKGKCIYLHRLIMYAEEHLQVDHIDCNPLNNTKKNLRLCLKIENDRNKPLIKSNKSGITGVRLSDETLKDSNRNWEAMLTYNKKKIP